MEVLLNGTLAGGICMCAPCNLIVNPGFAMLTGAITGVVAALGSMYWNDWCKKNIGLHDTCGVQSLHGIPGLIGGFTSAIACGASRYNFVVDEQLAIEFPFNWNTRSPRQMAGFQLAAIGITLGIAITTGLIGGFIASRLPFPENFFEDHEHFHEVEYGNYTAKFNVEHASEGKKFSNENKVSQQKPEMELTGGKIN